VAVTDPEFAVVVPMEREVIVAVAVAVPMAPDAVTVYGTLEMIVVGT
jgi:hypothetical protein